MECNPDKEAAADVDISVEVTETNSMRQVLIATNTSARNRTVGMGGVVCNGASGSTGDMVTRYSITLGAKDEQNMYTAELEAIGTASNYEGPTAVGARHHPGNLQTCRTTS